jgi:hypothetical protein
VQKTLKLCTYERHCPVQQFIRSQDQEIVEKYCRGCIFFKEESPELPLKRFL